MRFLTQSEVAARGARGADDLPRRLLETIAAQTQACQCVTIHGLVAQARRTEPFFALMTNADRFVFLSQVLDWFTRNGDVDRLARGAYACPPPFAVTGSGDAPGQGNWRLHLYGSPLRDDEIRRRVEAASGVFAPETFREDGGGAASPASSTPLPVGYGRRIELPGALAWRTLGEHLGVPVFDAAQVAPRLPRADASLFRVPVWKGDGQEVAPPPLPDLGPEARVEKYDPAAPGYWRWVAARPSDKDHDTFSLWRISTDGVTYAYYARVAAAAATVGLGKAATAPLRLVEDRALARLYLLALDRRSGNARPMYAPPGDNRLFVSSLTPEAATRWLGWASGSPVRRATEALGLLECRFETAEAVRSAADALAERLGYVCHDALPPATSGARS